MQNRRFDYGCAAAITPRGPRPRAGAFPLYPGLVGILGHPRGRMSGPGPASPAAVLATHPVQTGNMDEAHTPERLGNRLTLQGRPGAWLGQGR